MRLIPLKDKMQVGEWTARYIAEKINRFAPSADRPFVLGLPTGSTPLPVYQKLIELVITSYSIHYTKLYDIAFAAQDMLRRYLLKQPVIADYLTLHRSEQAYRP